VVLDLDLGGSLLLSSVFGVEDGVQNDAFFGFWEQEFFVPRAERAKPVYAWIESRLKLHSKAESHCFGEYKWSRFHEIAR
jgi:hypothetical protein